MSEKELKIKENIQKKIKERTKVCRALQLRIHEELDQINEIIKTKKIQAA